MITCMIMVMNQLRMYTATHYSVWLRRQRLVHETYKITIMLYDFAYSLFEKYKSEMFKEKKRKKEKREYTQNKCNASAIHKRHKVIEAVKSKYLVPVFARCHSLVNSSTSIHVRLHFECDAGISSRQCPLGVVLRCFTVYKWLEVCPWPQTFKYLAEKLFPQMKGKISEREREKTTKRTR